MEETIFQRSELLLGAEVVKRLAEIRVIVFGVGGVGSWCAEGLVRSGIQRLTIVDSDCVCLSNVNRQLMATTQTVGQPKVEVLRERLLTINPQAEITALQQVFSEETAERFGLEDYDYIIDAIDSLKDKAYLILLATQTKAQLFSSMGAALKLDASRIKVAEFWKVQGDPLARSLRKRFKHEGRYPERKFLTVYSDELLQNQTEIPQAEDSQKRVNGSLVHITAVFGFRLAGLVVQDVVNNLGSERDCD